jgi:hypothetical protein
MRWKSKESKEPNLGDIREGYVFAWFPTLVQNTDEMNQWYWIWLEPYYRKQEYKKATLLMPDRPMSVLKWVTIEATTNNLINQPKKW